ncbi:Spt2p LALA0_S07e07162g [Lachancea lanzarotensis]|uniref:LALA0S07e07162g1_1 n=1 Tax=Lachancea lanzarotensis TaxID=1245769 RepID=A0A0C7MZR2_9SACH|nr:uncharacterized protein LALA0_S07e07162g [Lachancea lanzarotensis]CEP63307.1 LALA0S07e07162g1_1 [Lachancea lanzarotensis]
MSFLAKLAQLKRSSEQLQGSKSAKDSSNGVAKKNGTSQMRSLSNEAPLLPSNYVRQEDPAVKRLKELRRKEKVKIAVKSGKKIPAPSSERKKKEGPSMMNTDTKFRRKVGDYSNGSVKPVQPIQRAPMKKLSFEELMKQADEGAKSLIEPSATAHNVSSGKEKSKVRAVQLEKPKRDSSVKKKISMPPRPHEGKKKTIPKTRQISVPAPSIAQPNAKLRKKLDLMRKTKQVKNDYSDEENDMDDFIEDDEKEAEYNRDEIWAIFNKGRKRRDFESDDESDMEANEMEILEEEEQASKLARLEDKKEEQWLKRHEEKKRRKFGRS